VTPRLTDKVALKPSISLTLATAKAIVMNICSEPTIQDPFSARSCLSRGFVGWARRTEPFEKPLGRHGFPFTVGVATRWTVPTLQESDLLRKHALKKEDPSRPLAGDAP
jgi:hypothetical protein